MEHRDPGIFSASSAAFTPPTSVRPESPAPGGPALVSTSPTTVGTGGERPPVVYLPCRLDGEGRLDEIALVRLVDGRTALVAFSAPDRLAAACGDTHAWVLWRTDELGSLPLGQSYDVAYLDPALTTALRGGTPDGTRTPGGSR